MVGTLIWVAFGALVVLGGVTVRKRLWRSRGGGRPTLDDDAVQRILDTGRVSLEEEPPLDLDEIEEAEERFWSESWDEPEEM